jgi:hypothetical protein
LWRSEFARHLREQGVRANATDRIVRGKLGRRLPDGKYRANQRGKGRTDESSTQRSLFGPPGVDFRDSPVVKEIQDGCKAVLRALEHELPPPTRDREREGPTR